MSNTPPPAPTGSASASLETVHLFVLAHGFVGGEKDLDYLRGAIELEAERASSDARTKSFAVCAGCNQGKTMDGVQRGGERLAQSIKDSITDIISKETTGASSGFKPSIHLTMLGNSLGGLYARYAAKLLFSGGPKLSMAISRDLLTPVVVDVYPQTFCTTVRSPTCNAKQRLMYTLIHRRHNCPCSFRLLHGLE